jgi:ATP-dependent protease ClpP protease subunit
MGFWLGMHPPPGLGVPGQFRGVAHPGLDAELDLARRNSRAAAATRSRPPQVAAQRPVPAVIQAAPARFYAPQGASLGRIMLRGGVGPGQALNARGLAASVAAARERGAGGLLVDLDSAGGEIAGARAMALVLQRFGREVGPVMAWVGGRSGAIAQSAATIVAYGAQLVFMDPESSMLIHEPSGGEPYARAAALASLVETYMQNTGLSEAQVSGLLSCGDTTFTAYRAVEHNFADAVLDEAQVLETARALAACGLGWSCAPEAQTRRQMTLACLRSR